MQDQIGDDACDPLWEELRALQGAGEGFRPSLAPGIV